MFKLEKGEKIILEIRKHWLVIFLEALFLFVVALIPLFVAYSFDKFILQGQEINLGGEMIYLFSFLYFLWLLGVWTAFFVQWTDYYLDVWYITPERIVAIDQKGLFRREVIDLRHEKVQDATVEINGIIPTLFSFGDIQVQTASEISRIIIRQAKDPLEAKRIILLHHSESIKRRGDEHHVME